VYAAPCGPVNNYCEPNDRALQAYGPLQPSVSYQAYPEGDEDYYSIYLTSSASIKVDLTDYKAVGCLFLYDGTGTEIPPRDCSFEDQTMNITANLSVPDGSVHIYYIRIYTYPFAINPGARYTLKVTY
jgi:hypothetical protein